MSDSDEPRLWREGRPVERVLFVTADVVGSGSLVRQLAVARRLPPDVEAIFLTCTPSASIVEQLGFHCEYVPPVAHTPSSPREWRLWLRAQCARLRREFGVGVVVDDGQLPRAALVPSSVLRRIVLGPAGGSATDADLVLAVDDFGSRRTVPATLRVDPIRLLDEDELLDRDAACAALGLDPEERHALVELGAGTRGDNVGSVVDAVVRHLLAQGGVRPVLVDQPWAPATLDLWPGALHVRCFPIARYLRAFEFAVSTADEVSFNDRIAFGLPTLFVAICEDEAARAAFAEEENAAVHLDEEARPHLHALLDLMANADEALLLRAGCARLRRPNGAVAAAQFVARLARESSASA